MGGESEETRDTEEGGIGGGGAGDKERLNSMAYNNAYVEGRWGLFRHAG